MVADPAQLPAGEPLSEAELNALVAGATWYVKYHEPIIASQTDGDSALAVSRREHFENLHAGLRKLGVRLRPLDVLRRPDSVR